MGARGGGGRARPRDGKSREIRLVRSHGSGGSRKPCPRVLPGLHLRGSRSPPSRAGAPVCAERRGPSGKAPEAASANAESEGGTSLLFRLPLSFHLAVLKREFCPRSHHAGTRDTDTLAPRTGLQDPLTSVISILSGLVGSLS